MINLVSSSAQSNYQNLSPESKGNAGAFDKAIEILKKAGLATEKNLTTLQKTLDGPELATQAIEALEQTGLLNERNLERLFSLDQGHVGVETVICLRNAHILTQKNFNRLCTGYPHKEDVIAMTEAHLLTEANFILLADCDLGDSEDCPIRDLRRLDLLTQEVIDAMAGSNLDSIFPLLGHIAAAKIKKEVDLVAFLKKDPDIQSEITDLIEYFTLTKEIFSILLSITDEELSDIRKGTDVLCEEKLLTQENVEAFFRAFVGVNGKMLPLAIQVLRQIDMLDQKNLDSLFTANGADPTDIAWGIYLLNNADILTPENRKAFLNGANIESLYAGILSLADAGILSQETFVKLLSTQEGVSPESMGEYLVKWHQTPRICQGTFQVYRSSLEENPRGVLRTWCRLPHPPQEIQFLTDDGDPLPGVNASGFPLQFYAELVENLFKEGVVFSSIDPETGMPTNANFDEHRETIEQMGILFGHMYDHNLIFGKILPEEFFSILATLKSYRGDLFKKKAIIGILKIESARVLQDWLEREWNTYTYYRESRKAACRVLREIEGEFISDCPDGILDKKANQIIQEMINPYILIAKAFLSGISSRLFSDLSLESVSEVSDKLQGTLDVNKILSALHLYTNDPSVLEKVEWIKERLLEEALIEDSTWNKRFVSLITGQKALQMDASIRIYMATGPSITAQPQFGTLHIPANSLTRKEFFEELDRLMIATLTREQPAIIARERERF